MNAAGIDVSAKTVTYAGSGDRSVGRVERSETRRHGLLPHPKSWFRISLARRQISRP